jgi:radical SAM protein with 4Fe4S-binding SPASM domain
VDVDYTVKRVIEQEPLWKGKGPRLPRLDIELTERCNNACMHCYINLPVQDAQAASRELSTHQWKDILQQAADLGALSVRFTGGEPLLREDFTELYLFARRLGLQVMLFTNARLVTPKLADLFARVSPRQKIEISVYGMHPESYDTVTCTSGAYAEFRRGVDLLQERQVPFVVKSVLLPPNRSEIDEFEAWAETLPWMDRPPSYAIFLELRARRDSQAKNKLIRSLRFSPQEGLALVTRDETAYRRAMAQFTAGFMGPQGDHLFTCGAGETGCVDAYGIYQMCMPLRHPETVYDLKQGTLREALTEVFPRLRELRATNPDYLDRCARCFLKGLCEQCPGKSWTEYGTLDTPVEYLCQVAHAQARYLGLLNEAEQAWEIQDWQARLSQFADQEDSALPG